MQTHSIPTNGRELANVRKGLSLTTGQFAAVLGISPAGLALRELGLVPVGATVSQLAEAFAQGFRPNNWPVNA